MAIEKETEERIFEAAQRVFQLRGFEGARMQEIADEAGINKSMLHYYFRSKSALFQEVFKSSVKKIMPKLFAILANEKTLREKVVQVVNFYHDVYLENTHLPAFVVYEMNQHPERFKEFIKSMDMHLPEEFIEQVEEGVASGKMRRIAPDQFLINVISLCMMPMIARNMAQTLFHLDDTEYDSFLNERRELIPNLIFNGVIL